MASPKKKKGMTYAGKERCKKKYTRERGKKNTIERERREAREKCKKRYTVMCKKNRALISPIKRTISEYIIYLQDSINHLVAL